MLFGLVIVFSDSSRDFALDSTWNWQRRAASAVIDPLPAAAGATAAAGKGLSTAGWLRCISMKLTADLCSVIPRFLKVISGRLRSWWAPSRSETLKISMCLYPVQVLWRGTSTRYSAPVLVVLLATGLAAVLAVNLAS